MVIVVYSSNWFRFVYFFLSLLIFLLIFHFPPPHSLSLPFLKVQCMCVPHSKFPSLFTFHSPYLFKFVCFSCCVTIKIWCHYDAICPRTWGHYNTIMWRGSKGSKVQCVCTTMHLSHFESPFFLESELESPVLLCPWVFCVFLQELDFFHVWFFCVFTRIWPCFQVSEFVVCFYKNSIFC
jgi:hypothetical protein